MISKKTAILFDNVSFSYNGIQIIEDVNLKITEHELISIVGPNGGGKTTLIKLILGLIQPSKGKITVFGNQPSKSRHLMGYMSQYVDYDPQFPVNVMDVVLMGRLGKGNFKKFLGWYTKEDKKFAIKALEDVEMDMLANRSIQELSGGQRQRVMIARALAGQPKLLLLDEPTSNVDAQIETKFINLLKKLNKSITILMVSHDIGFVSKSIQSVICVNRKVVIHPTSEISGQIITDIYCSDMRLIRHDHRCSEKGHFTCD